ncbi:MAG: hypothetical protein JWR44_960 [Hymenobacter sp.]|nr:hypothetical protein [Hymenobacter sp.]
MGWVALVVMPSGASAQQQSRSSADAPSAAQQLVEEIGLERLPTSTLVPRASDARNLSVLKQTGSGNEADIIQVSLGAGPNQAMIVQAGAANIVVLDQFGVSNNASLTLTGNGNKGTVDQRGSNNSFDGNVTGDRNKVDVYQDGHGNQSRLDVESNGRRYPVVQIGDNNSLTQRENATSTAPQGYGVEMRGNGIRLTIEQGRVNP